jgi:hypothetical protein
MRYSGFRCVRAAIARTQLDQGTVVGVTLTDVGLP